MSGRSLKILKRRSRLILGLFLCAALAVYFGLPQKLFGTILPQPPQNLELRAVEPGAPSATAPPAAQTPRPTSPPAPSAASSAPLIPSGASLEGICRLMAERFAGQNPTAWGESIPGVYTRLAPSGDGHIRVALTLDACGGGAGSGVDLGILELLEKNKVPATLFLNARWIDANPDLTAKLAANPLFELENHGFKHKPLSVNGREAYGITGTTDPASAAREVEAGARKLAQLTGKRPLFFRSGTAYYDDVALKILEALGCKAAGFSIIGDAGATLPATQVAARLRAARDGDIVILHFNRPKSGTREGLREALPELLARGVIFVRLADVKVE